MTTGSYYRNSRVPTPGLYGGVFSVGPISSKSWSGDNQNFSYRNTPNVVSYYESTRSKVQYLKTVTTHRAIRYAWKTVKLSSIPRSERQSFVATHAGATPVYFEGTKKLRGFKIRVPVVRLYRKTVRTPINVSITKLRKRREGGRPPKRARKDEHPYSCTYDESRNCVVNYTLPGIGNFSQASNSIIDSYSFSGGWTSNDDLKLFDKLRTRVAGSQFSAGIALAESRQTLALITSSATKIYQALRAIKRGDVVSAANYLSGRKALRSRSSDKKVKQSRRTIQENWLQLQYGWLPLVNDVYEGAQFLAHSLNVPIQQTHKVSREIAAVISWKNDDWRYISSRSVTKVGIKAIIHEQDVPALAGLQDPASVAWEALPYSFVADWFIPIGSYLSARGLSQSLKGTFVVSKKVYEKHSGFMNPSGSYQNVSFSGDVSLERGTFNRTVSSELQIPLPSWKPLSKVASWQHCVNAIALITSFRK